MKKQIKHFHKLLRILSSILLMSLLLASCQRKELITNDEVIVNTNPISKQAFLLNTIITITVYDEEHQEALDGALKLCEEYEYLLSRTIETSIISQMNHRNIEETTFTLEDNVWDVLERGMFYSQISDGAFDITVEPLSSLWNFSSASPSVPPTKAIEAAVAKVDYHNVELTSGQITFLSPETKLDLGAVAKGYIADKIKEYLLAEGVESAIINLGGNVLCIGSKPDGTPFKVGIQKPFENRNETIGSVDIRDLSVVSSGVYERFFKQDGINYHHILDPDTGWPVENDLISVTIISESSADGDGLSTTCFALGLEKGIELIDSLENIYAIFITSDGEIHYSASAEELVTLNN